ncbi:MAG: type II toxin-antitoxin system mRNA interferase toxin, RelE/StbE family [Patescibacteria group bacterium]
MVRAVHTTPRFERRLTSFVKSHQNLRTKISSLIDRLAKNPFDPKNKTHSLSGELKGMYSASIDKSYRIVFVMGSEAITLINIGSHDEVYGK